MCRGNGTVRPDVWHTLQQAAMTALAAGSCRALHSKFRADHRLMIAVDIDEGVVKRQWSQRWKQTFLWFHYVTFPPLLRNCDSRCCQTPLMTVGQHCMLAFVCRCCPKCELHCDNNFFFVPGFVNVLRVEVIKRTWTVPFPLLVYRRCETAKWIAVQDSHPLLEQTQ